MILVTSMGFVVRSLVDECSSQLQQGIINTIFGGDRLLGSTSFIEILEYVLKLKKQINIILLLIVISQ